MLALVIRGVRRVERLVAEALRRGPNAKSRQRQLAITGREAPGNGEITGQNRRQNKELSLIDKLSYHSRVLQKLACGFGPRVSICSKDFS